MLPALTVEALELTPPFLSSWTDMASTVKQLPYFSTGSTFSTYSTRRRTVSG
jgi:hypothetical protein